MPYVPHMRATFRGQFMGPQGPVEDWQFGLALKGIVGDPGTVQQGDLDSVVDAISGLWGNTDMGLSDRVPVKEVKVAPIGADGKYTSGPLIASVNIPGGIASPPTFPPQVALVISLMTATRGSSGRGRVYLPAPNFPIGADWRIPTSHTTAQAVAFAQFIKDLASTGEPTPFPTDALYTVCVASSKGLLSPVSGVRVGQALDTMRSRRRSLVENYVASDSVTNVVPLPGH